MPRPGRTPSIAVLALLALVAVGCGGDRGGQVVARAKPPAARATETGAAALLVDVAGHVRRPGVYRLAVGARVHEAIAAAGGARPGADLGRINRAATLVDGQQVLVASSTPEAVPEGSRGAGDVAGGGGTVSINAADASALDALPGIGPVTAERIVADREASGPYATLDDLDRVSGIGPATIEALREVATP